MQEMMRVLLDKLEEKMKDTAVEGTIGSLFAGEKQRKNVQKRMREREKERKKERDRQRKTMRE